MRARVLEPVENFLIDLSARGRFLDVTVCRLGHQAHRRRRCHRCERESRRQQTTHTTDRLRVLSNTHIGLQAVPFSVTSATPVTPRPTAWPQLRARATGRRTIDPPSSGWTQRGAIARGRPRSARWTRRAGQPHVSGLARCPHVDELGLVWARPSTTREAQMTRKAAMEANTNRRAALLLRMGPRRGRRARRSPPRAAADRRAAAPRSGRPGTAAAAAGCAPTAVPCTVHRTVRVIGRHQ